MRIAVIPARGGSKRVPRKNIKFFCGKPMIAWAIEAAQKSGLFDRIVVSTDDLEIANIAQQYGAEVPFLRPDNISNDYVSATAVVAHATEWAINKGFKLRAVCCILATAPFINQSDLQNGWEVFSRGDWNFVFAATEFAAPIFRAFRVIPSGGLEMYFPEHFNSRSQDLPISLYDAAQFYWGKPSAWLEGHHVFGITSTVVTIPRWRVQDIDTPEDWQQAEKLAKLINKESP